jgi:hypothetical protein
MTPAAQLARHQQPAQPRARSTKESLKWLARTIHECARALA